MMHMNNKRTPSLYGTQWSVPNYNKPPSKVVSIPVHFVGSERSRSESATKIQKVVRGFLVKKSVKKMVALRVELEEIEKNVNAFETLELMRREQKERVRFGESIMNLLLRLDSVRIFHCSALRELRRSLIKRAIVIQEMVDQIQTVGPTNTSHHQPQSTQVECVGVIEEESCLEKEEVGCEEEEEEEEHEGGNKMEALVNEEKNEVEEDCLVKEKEGQDEGEEHEEGKKMEALGKEEKMENGEGGSMGEECVLVEEDCVVKEEDGGIRIGCEEEEEEMEEEEEEEEENYKGEVGDGENRELLKRMVEDNEKMMEMMAKLFERNEMQTKLLTSLTQRVEQLERAFTCDKLRRRKRRNLDAKHKQIDPKNGCT